MVFFKYLVILFLLFHRVHVLLRLICVSLNVYLSSDIVREFRLRSMVDVNAVCNKDNNILTV